ncbi:hypothetical protein F4825DRAFT_291314 [Nemania diffusa]|nr:hypothetical protein F4825DRAFT_291314 [Nemania diffusa]
MATSTAITFHSPDDFHLWEEDFIAGARSRDLWTYLVPGPTRAPWPERPSAPAMAEFAGANADPLGISIIELTTPQRTLYLAAEQSYDTAMKHYNAHRTKLTELTEWMRKTVHPNYRLTHMKANETIDKWYDKLRELGTIARQVLKFKYKQEYENFIHSTATKPIKDLAKWTDEWLNKITKADAEGADVTEPFKLITDLERALRTTHPAWTAGFRNAHSAEIISSTLSYHTIASELRREAVVLNVIKTGGKLVRGGAFPAFQEEQDKDEPANQERRDRQGQSRQERRERERRSDSRRGRQRRDIQGSSRSDSRKRPRADTRTENEKENPNVTDCIVCYGRHPVAKCWFAFPEDKPDDWILNTTIERIAKLRLNTDEAVKRAVERAKQQRREKKPKKNELKAAEEED